MLSLRDVTLRMAKGGYIIEWYEFVKDPEERKPRLTPGTDLPVPPVIRKQAVRESLEAALKLAHEQLKKKQMLFDNGSFDSFEATVDAMGVGAVARGV